MKHITYLLTLFSFLSFSCQEENTTMPCGSEIIISEEFDNVDTQAYSILSASVNGECLEVTISAGGCDGESWTAQMYGAEVMIQVYPPTIPLKLSLTDEEDCEALVKKTFSFDLTSIIENYSQFSLSIEGYDVLISYNAVNLENLEGTWNLVNINGGLMGANQDYDSGEIAWTFDSENVIITDNSEGSNIGIEAGTYTYSISSTNDTSYDLVIGDQNLGYIRYLTSSSFSVDQRAVDGFQYVFER